MEVGVARPATRRMGNDTEMRGVETIGAALQDEALPIAYGQTFETRYIRLLVREAEDKAKWAKSGR